MRTVICVASAALMLSACDVIVEDSEPSVPYAQIEADGPARHYRTHRHHRRNEIIVPADRSPNVHGHDDARAPISAPVVGSSNVHGHDESPNRGPTVVVQPAPSQPTVTVAPQKSTNVFVGIGGKRHGAMVPQANISAQNKAPAPVVQPQAEVTQDTAASDQGNQHGHQ